MLSPVRECVTAGTSPEGVDVRDYADVGVTNMAVATGLTLQEGHTYYVTVRGERLFTNTYVTTQTTRVLVKYWCYGFTADSQDDLLPFYSPVTFVAVFWLTTFFIDSNSFLFLCYLFALFYHSMSKVF